VTNNLKDFPEKVLAKYEVEAQSSDIFLSHLYDLNPMAFIGAVQQQRKRLINPKHTAEELLTILYNQGLPLIVNKLKENIELF